MSSESDRAALAAAVCTALEGCCPGSDARPAGSLASGTQDAFSDIDITWVVPDARFPDCLARVAEALGEVRPVDDVRGDPDLLHSDRRRVLFVRFAEVPLFWRLDLDVRTASVANDPHHDEGNPAARAREGEWSRPASALANAIGAVKAVARRRDTEARGLLDRGFARIGEDDRASGAWASDVARLARAAAMHDPSLSDLAARVTALAARQPGGEQMGRPCRDRSVGSTVMVDFYPPTSPYDHGLLDTSDGNRIYYEQYGNPEGKPAVNVHGGPGAGASRRPTRAWDPERYRVIRFDQRNCGRSTPHASDPAADMGLNTTQHLIDDMERLREHLGIERWLLNGASWATTLIVAYAQQHPERVSEVVLQAVTTARRCEIDWLYRGARRFQPEAWERFRDGVPPDERDGDLLAAYARLMEHPDRAVRARAAADWLAWEDAVISTEPDGASGTYSDRDVDAQIAFVRICAHFFSNGAWLEDGQLLRDAHRLAGIPAVIVQGRHDMGCPVQTAWELAKAWPGARLHVFEDSGHVGGDAMGEVVRAAIEEFKYR